METILKLHVNKAEKPLRKLTDGYAVIDLDYNLERDINRKGDVLSPLRSSYINVTLSGLPSKNILNWLFNDNVMEAGEIISMDESAVLDNLKFEQARPVSFNLHYDARDNINSVTSSVRIKAKMVSSDCDISYENKSL